MAEFLFKDMLQKNGLSSEYEVFSRGLVTDTRGMDMHNGSKDQLRKHNIPFTTHHADQITREEYDSADYVIVMDQYNLVLLKRLFFLKGKMKAVKLLSFAGENRDIQDPYYTKDFETAYKDIEKGGEALLKYLKNN